MASWLNISSIKDNISSFTREVLTEAGNDTFNTSAGESDGEEDGDYNHRYIENNDVTDRLRSMQDELNSMSLDLTSRDEHITLLERENDKIKLDAEKHVSNLKQHLLEKENELDNYALKVKELEDSLCAVRNENSRLQEDLHEQDSKANDWDNWESNSTGNADISKLEMENESLSNEVMMKEIVLNSIEAKMKQISKRTVDAAEFSTWIDEVLKESSSQSNDSKTVSLMKVAMENDDVCEFNEESVSKWLARRQKQGNEMLELQKKIADVEQAVVHFDNSLHAFKIEDFPNWLLNIKNSSNQNTNGEEGKPTSSDEIGANQDINEESKNVISNIEKLVSEYDDDDIDFTIQQFPSWIEKVFNKLDDLSIELINENEIKEREEQKRIAERQKLEELFNEKQNEISMLKVELFNQRNVSKETVVSDPLNDNRDIVSNVGRVNELEETVNELTARCEALQNELQSSQQNIRELETIKVNLQQVNETLETEKCLTIERNNEMKKELNDLYEKLKCYDDSEPEDSQGELLEKVQDEVERLTNEISDYENQIESLTLEKEDLLNELQTLKEESDGLGDDQIKELRLEKEALEWREVKIVEILQEVFPDEDDIQTRGIVEILQAFVAQQAERKQTVEQLETRVHTLQEEVLKENSDGLGDDQIKELRQEKEALEWREVKIVEILQEAFPDEDGVQTRGIMETLQAFVAEQKERKRTIEELETRVHTLQEEEQFQIESQKVKNELADLQTRVNTFIKRHLNTTVENPGLDTLDQYISALQLCQADKQFLDGQLEILTKENEKMKDKLDSNKSSQEDIDLLKSKIQELEDANTALNVEVSRLVKLETSTVPSSESEERIVELEGLLSEKTSEAEYFQEACGEFEGKMQEVQNENYQLRYQYSQLQNALQQTQNYYTSLLQSSNISSAAIENQNKLHNLSLMLTEKSEECLRLQSHCDELNARLVTVQNDTSDMALVREECKQLKAMLMEKEQTSRVDDTISMLQQENKQLKILITEHENEMQNLQKLNLERENDLSDMTLLREECKQLKQMLIEGSSSQDDKLKPLEERCQYLEQLLQEKESQIITVQNENSDLQLIKEECKQLKQMLIDRDESQQVKNQEDFNVENEKLVEVENLLIVKDAELQNKNLQLQSVQQELENLRENVNSFSTSDVMVQSYNENSFLAQVQQLEELIREKDSAIAQKDAIIIDLQNSASDMNLLHDECRALKRMLTEKEQMFVELQDDVDNANDVIQQKNEELKRIQQEKDKIGTKLSEANVKIINQKQEYEMLAEELNQSMAQEENIHMLQTEYRNVEERFKESEQELENTRERLFQAETHCSRLQTYEEQFNELKLAFKEKDEELTYLKLQSSENTILESETVNLLQQELNQLKTLVYEKEQEHLQMDAVLTKKNTELQHIYVNFNEVQQKLNSLGNQNWENVEKVENLMSENKRLVELLTEKRNTIDKLSFDLKELTSKLEISRSEYHQIANKLEQKTQRLEEVWHSLEEKNNHINELERKINEASILIVEKEALIDSLENKIDSQLHLQESMKTELQKKLAEVKTLEEKIIGKEGEMKQLQVRFEDERMQLDQVLSKVQDGMTSEGVPECVNCNALRSEMSVVETLVRNLVQNFTSDLGNDMMKNLNLLEQNITLMLKSNEEIQSTLKGSKEVLKQLNIEQEESSDRINLIVNENNNLKTQNDSLKNENMICIKENENLQLAIKELNEVNKILKSEHDSERVMILNEKEQLGFKIKDLESQIFEYREMEEAYLSKCQEVNGLNKQINLLNSERNRILFSKEENANSFLKEECEKLQIELEKSSQKYVQKTKESDTLKLENLKLEEQVHDLQVKNKQLKSLEEKLQTLHVLQANMSEKSAEIHNLKSLLEDEQTKVSMYQKDKNMMEAMLQQSEQLRAEVQDLQLRNTQLSQLIQEKDVILKHQEVTTREVEAKTSRELERLRHHLMTTEEAHTQEILESQQREQNLQDELKSLKEGLSKKSIILEDSSKQFQDHVSELEEQLHVLSAQRDSQALEISKYKQQLEHNSLAMINLQSALEQIQKEKNEQYDYLTSLHQRKQSELEMKLKDMSEDQQRMQVTMAEASLAVQGINKLRLELSHKDNELSLTKEKVNDLSSSLQEYHEKWNQMMQSSDSKLDKSLVRNLVMQYFQASEDKRADIVQVIGNLLGLTQQEIQQIGNGSAPSKVGGWITSVWGFGSTPKKTIPQPKASQLTVTAQQSTDMSQSFSELFVKFLEHETESKSNIKSASLALDDSTTRTNLLMPTPSPPDILAFHKEDKRSEPRIPAPGQEIPRVHTHHAQTTLKSLLA